MAARITFKGNRAELRAHLRNLPRLLTGRGPDPTGTARAMQLRLGLALTSKIQQAFVVKARGGTDEAGIKWEPLTPGTMKGRRKGKKKGKYAGRHEILRDTGVLLRSLTPGTDRPGPEGVLDTPSGKVIVGTNVPYATYHQHGTRRMPARPIFPAQIPPAWWQYLLGVYRRGLAQVLATLLARGRLP